MARTVITSEVMPTNTPLALEDLTFTAADTSNGNAFAYTGRDALIVWNSHASTTYTFTPTSVAINGRQDPKNGVAQNLTAGQFMLVNYRGEGWKQSDGNVYIDANNAAIKFCPIVLPA